MADGGFLQQMLMIMGSYIGIVLLAFGILGWMMAGLLMPYLKVKTSRGKLILVKVKSITQDYYKPGKIDKGFLIFKDKAKDERRIKIPQGAIYRSMGVNVIDVDDEKNAINKIDYSVAEGFDATKYNDLYLRALYKPSLFDKKEQILLALVVICLIGIVVVLFVLFSLQGDIAQLSQVAAPQVVPGGA